MHYKLSPSDFTFLYEGCKRCYYLKVVHNIPQPSVPLPSIFSEIAGLLKNHYDGKHTKELYPGLPPGQMVAQGTILWCVSHRNDFSRDLRFR